MPNDNRGYSERDHRRITSAVLKSERQSGAPLPGSTGAIPRPQKYCRVKITDNLTHDNSVVGTRQVQKNEWEDDEESWVDTTEKIPNIHLGHPDQADIPASIAEPTYIWIVASQGRWYVIGETCPPRNEVWLVTIFGNPTGGTFKLKNVTINGVAEDVTLNYNSSAASAQTALEGHSELASGDVTVSGGSLPTVSLKIEFTGDQAATAIPAPIPDTTSLTGGSGVGIILSRYQPGHPNDV